MPLYVIDLKLVVLRVKGLYVSVYIYMSLFFFSFFQLSVKTCFIRGSVVRYVQLPADECDTQLLQDAARKEAAQNKQR